LGEELLNRLVHRMARSLGAFRSTAQALLNGADEDPILRRELLHDMDVELGELQRLLENVTQYKALERGTFLLYRRELLPTPWLRQLLARWQRFSSNKGFSWIVDIPDGLPPVFADLDKLEQSLNNLLANAVRHTPLGAQLSFRAWRGNGLLHLRLSSERPRLSEEDYERLFELFYTGQVQGRFPTGLGLGLHITRKLIEEHNGRMDLLQPTPADDSIGFEITLPLIPAENGDPSLGITHAGSPAEKQSQQSRL
jgi:signal transduction histidine kinase